MLNKINKNKVKATLVCSFLIYILLNSLVLLRREQMMNKLEKYDLDKNGFVDNKEISSEYLLVLKNATSDTGMSLAPITSIPIALFFGFLFFLFIKFIPRRELTNSDVN